MADALDDRPVPAVWPRPTHVGNENDLADFWIIEGAAMSGRPREASPTQEMI
jgi:hypothetical protein